MKLKNGLHDDDIQLYLTLPKYLSVMILGNFQVLSFDACPSQCLVLIEYILIAHKWKVSVFCMSGMG